MLPHKAIIEYLKYIHNQRAKIFILKHDHRLNPRLKVIDIDENLLTGKQSTIFVDYLIHCEKVGDRLFISYPAKGLRRLIFN
jgi:hypothetical protein